MMKTSRRKTIFSLLFFVLASTFLFLGFYRNQWQMARPKKFSLFQKDVEAYVIGRLVMTRQNGIFSHGGLLGWGDVDAADVTNIGEEAYQHQYDVYLGGLSFGTFLVKESHPGFQGIFFSALDRISPFSSSENLRIFRILSAGIFAVVLTGVLLWFLWELGWLAAVFVFISILISQWMTLFGRNLFFVSGVFFIPMLVLLFRLYKEATGRQVSQNNLFWLMFSSILLKCLFNGFDFILPTLCMAASPLIFYGTKDRWDRRTFTRRFVITVLAALGAILASLVVLSFQTMLATGSLAQGIGFILGTIDRRMLANDPYLASIYAQAKNASIWSILKVYLTESYLYRYYVPYYALIIVFAIVSAAQIWLDWIRSSLPSKGMALVAATWFSILGPLSWYVVFKSVAYFHTHMNYLPWHMPFTLSRPDR